MKIGLGILVVALVATLGDYTWYTLGVRHNIATGIVHGAVLLTAVGAVLGIDAGRFLRGLPIGALSGVGGALIYYLLVAVMDRRTYGTAIPAAWVGMWLLIALLDGRWLRAPQRRPWGEIVLRGVLAAVLGGMLGINNNSNNIDNAFAQEGAITPEGVNNTMSRWGMIQE